MSRGLLWVALFLLIWPAPWAAAGPAGALTSVVSLLPLWAGPLWDGRPPNPEEPEGSAVVIAKEGSASLLLTADHVLADADRFIVRTAEGVAYPASLLRRDRDSDLALLRAEVALPALLPASAPALGAKVCAIGNAFGLGLSLSCGVLSAKQRAGVGFNRIEDFLQSDAAVNPGMSGGALLDADGRLIGLISAIFTKGSDADIGVNFAVSTEVIEAALPALKAGGPVDWPQVDVLFAPKSSDATGPLGPKVARVPLGGTAKAAGLLPGDRILAADGRRVRNLGDWRTAIALSQKDATIPLEIWRDADRMTLQLTLPGR